MVIGKIKNRKAKIGIIGLGYVGLPLVREFVNAGFPVTGFDIDKAKVKVLMAGKSYLKHFSDKQVENWLLTKRFLASADFEKLHFMDAIIICVPTPLDAHRQPDLSFVVGTANTIARFIKKGQLIILESTTYPGTTDEDMRNILEKSGLKAGKDFYLAFSPEREDPNNKQYSTATIPKVVGGYTKKCLLAARELYSAIIEKVVPVSSTKTAEAVKLLENIYRAVNIAMVNEFKMLFDKMGIDVWEVIEAAKTKPFGFQAFYPGPGLGGHCIPIDPFYLTWKAREYGFATRFIELAGEINTGMPHYVVQKTIDALNERNKSVKGAKILILGLAYKKDVDDVRESPALELIKLLETRGALVDYNDPYVKKIPKLRKYNIKKSSVELTPEQLRSYDCVVIATDHSVYEPDMIAAGSVLVIDTRNLIKNRNRYSGKVISA